MLVIDRTNRKICKQERNSSQMNHKNLNGKNFDIKNCYFQYYQLSIFSSRWSKNSSLHFRKTWEFILKQVSNTSNNYWQDNINWQICKKCMTFKLWSISKTFCNLETAFTSAQIFWYINLTFRIFISFIFHHLHPLNYLCHIKLISIKVGISWNRWRNVVVRIRI